MTTAHPLRWGILATGWIAEQFSRDAQLAGLNVAAVGSRTAESAQRFATDFNLARAHSSYAELAADPEVDIIYVATPHPMHYEHTMLALDHGKHVLVEKPFTLNQRQAEQVRGAAREKGLLATEAMWTRYLPHMVRIREILASGTLGEVRAVFADHTSAFTTDPQHRINALELGGGALLDLGVYPVSFAHDLLGVPDTVSATGSLTPTGVDGQISIALG